MTRVDFLQIQTILGSPMDDPAWKKLLSQLPFSQQATNATLTFKSGYLWFDYSVLAKEFVACGVDKNAGTHDDDSLIVVLPGSIALGESRSSVQEKLGKSQWTGSYNGVKVDLSNWSDAKAESLPFEIENAPFLVQDLYTLEGIAIYMRFDSSHMLEAVLFSRLNQFDEVRIMQGEGKNKQAAELLADLLHQRITADNLLMQNDCFELAQAFELANEYEKAEEYYRQAISFSRLPIAGFIRKGYSELLFRQGKIEKGLDQLELWCVDPSTPSQIKTLINRRMDQVLNDRKLEG